METRSLVLKPTKGWAPLRLGELWEYHELMYFIAWRDVSSRYRQTVLGIGWAVVQPVATMLVFTCIFGRLARLPSDGLPYSMFSYTALLPWQFLSSATTSSGASLLGNAHLLTKVYFPRLVLPIASTLPPILDFSIALVLLFGMLIFFGVSPTLNILWFPGFFLLAYITALGAGVWLSALGIRYRDVKHITPFAMQLWMFTSPVAYSSSMVPPQWKPLYALNPMSGVIDGFRWCFLNAGTCPIESIAISGIVALTLLITGLYYFRRMESTIADVI